MNTIERIRCAVLLVAVALAGAAGCSAPKAFSLDSAWPWKDDEPEPEVPNRVVGMWTDTVLSKAGQVPQRGFGGRLYFYGKDANKPVLVEGELVVYAFDETGREPTDNKPTRRYVFPTDQVVLHQSESPVGPSYSFWLPWDEAGGARTEISLLCRFQPKGGPVVISEQTRHVLPGSILNAGTNAGPKTPKLPEGVPSRPAIPQLSSKLSGQSVPAASGAQLANYEVPVAAAPAPIDAAATAPQSTSGLATTSIALPRDFEIPRGGIPIASVKKQPAAPVQPAATAGLVAYPLVAAAPNPVEQATPSRSGTSYQPGTRFVTPTPYNPALAPPAPPNTNGINQPLQLPTATPINAPRIVPPQTAPQPSHTFQQMQQLYQQQLAAQQTGGGPALTSSQSVPQMPQIPTTGTAAVTYR